VKQTPIAQQVIKLEWRVSVLENLLQEVVKRIGVGISQDEYDTIRDEALEKIKEQYPDVTIQRSDP